MTDAVGPYERFKTVRSKERSINQWLRELVVMAGELAGEDGNGKDGMLGYLTRIARQKPELYVPLLAKVIPHIVQSPDQPEKEYRTREEIQAELAQRGLPTSGVLINDPVYKDVTAKMTNGKGNGANGVTH